MCTTKGILDRLITEETQIKEGIVSDGIGVWTKTLEEALAFASKLTLLFETTKEDPIARRMILKILGSNLELKDKKVRITAKKLFVFFKQVGKSQNSEIDWLEPENSLITWDNQTLPPVHSHMELDTVLGSNLSKYITPDLGLQLSALKKHLGLSSFAFV